MSGLQAQPRDKVYLLERVHVDENDCWLWLLAKYRNGYGQLHVRGPVKRALYAHRVSYEVFVGPIPEGLEIDHLCRNRACINPVHLEPVTHVENVRRGAAVGLRPTCARGHSWDEMPPIVRPNGHRTCRICYNKSNAARMRRVRAKKKELLADALSH